MNKPGMTKLGAGAALLLSLSMPAAGACSSKHPSPANGSAGSSSTTAGAPSAGSLVARLKTADGREVATAGFDFSNGYATVTVKTVAPGILAPGFHDMHVHEIGKCEPNSVAPGGGPPGDFLSGGGHYQAPGHTGKPESGDLTSLQVRSNGSAYLVTTTDAFTRDDLLAGNKTALMIHDTTDSDMGGMGGMSMKRIACGVIEAG